jgi:hypothetical protein
MQRLRDARSIATAALLGLFLVVAGCGRVGLDLVPRPDADSTPGGNGDDAGASSGEGDGGADDAGTGDAAPDAGQGDGGDDCIVTAGASSPADATCDGVDDDCDGSLDEDYAPDAACGVGYCMDANTPSSCTDAVETACAPAAPLSALDDSDDGIDDDCDGAADDDICPVTTETFAATGLHQLVVPFGCSNLGVQLWGAGGASGDAGGYWGTATGGAGGPGGFAERSFGITAASVIELRVGEGGQSCGVGGGNVDVAYSGGDGATDRAIDGESGGDGSEPGGTGATPGDGGNGGRGYFGGGGGGGGGGPAWNPFGRGGGGGAASAVLVDGMRVVAGGGGGGGGAGSTIASNGVSGGDGGTGCSGDGANGGNDGAGGGAGGGLCDGATIQQGALRDPHVPAGVSLPAGTATGGATTGECVPGGNGYAIITWSR